MKKFVINFLSWRVKQAELNHKMAVEDYAIMAGSDNEYGKEKLWSAVCSTQKELARRLNVLYRAEKRFGFAAEDR